MKKEIIIKIENEGYKATVLYNGSIYHTIEGSLQKVDENIREDIAELVMEAYREAHEINIMFTDENENEQIQREAEINGAEIWNNER